MDRKSRFSGRAGKCIGVAALVAALVLPVIVTTQNAEAVATSSGAYFGAYVQPRTGFSRADQEASVNNLESYLGTKLDIDHMFHPWNNVFPTWRQTWDLQNGRIPMISWGGTYLSQILNGSLDPMIRNRADGLKGLGGRVLLRWFAEMDAFIYENDEIQSPAQFISAWRRVHDIFVDRGATNVEWVWCPGAQSFRNGVAQQYYPGDAYVDWICADGYNWAPARAGSSWNSFKDIFAAFYAWAAAKPQPLMVGETAVMENRPGDKAAWITDMGNTLKTVYPEIKAVLYFDAYATANFGGWYDWRVDTSTSSYEAFRALANDPYFNGGSATPDTLAPTPPSDLQAAASGARVDLTWTASTDDVGVEGYDVLRDGAIIASVPATSYSDTTISAGSSYSYQIRAHDTAGNTSDSCSSLSVTIPSGGVLFGDDFESGSMSAWTTASRVAVRSGGAFSGGFAAEAAADGTRGSFATRTLPEGSAELYARTWFKVSTRSGMMNLIRLQSSGGANIVTLFVNTAGDLMVRNDVRGTNVWSSTRVTSNTWHQVQLRAKVGTSGSIEVWYDAQRIAALSTSLNLGVSSLGRLMVGDNVSGRSYRVLFDNVALSQVPIA